MKNLPKISIIIIHYNRLDCLIETIESFKSKCKYKNIEFIIADDNSNKDVKKEILNLKVDILVTNYTNKGLGNNTNNALYCCRGDYILQLQDDWLYIGKEDLIEKSILLFEKNEDIDIIRYYNKKLYHTKKIDDYFSKIDLDNITSEEKKILYSDTPHMKKKCFHEKYGYYMENINMNQMEIKFAENFSKKSNLNVVFSNSDQFKHIGANKSYNPSVKKNKLYQKLRGCIFTRYFVDIYMKKIRKYKDIFNKENSHEY